MANVSQWGTPLNILDLTDFPEKYFGENLKKFTTNEAKCTPSGTSSDQNVLDGHTGQIRTPEELSEARRWRTAGTTSEMGGQIQACSPSHDYAKAFIPSALSL
jgi:hypothetical protein